jgi:hypothetical protein
MPDGIHLRRYAPTALLCLLTLAVLIAILMLPIRDDHALAPTVTDPGQ